MQEFRSVQEVRESGLAENVAKVVEGAVRALVEAYGEDFDADDCGWVVLVDQSTTEEDARETFGVGWEDLVTEGTTHDRENGLFLTAWLPNNQFGLTLVVRDEPGLCPVLREKLAAGVVTTTRWQHAERRKT